MRLLDYFIKNCNERPGDVFYSDDPISGYYTLRYVNECSSKVYSYLSSQGIGAEDVVAIDLPRSGKIPIAIIGIMKAGAAFVIIGGRSDRQTASFILSETSPKLIIDRDMYEKMMHCTPLDGYREPSPHDLAAIIYSSGATGVFKGCMHEYGVYDDRVDRVLYYRDGNELSFGPILLHSRYALTLGFYTVSAIYQLCYNMISGEYFDIVPYYVTDDPKALKERLADRRITEAFLSPRQIASMDISSGLNLKYVDSLYEMFGGFYTEKPILINCYGMTESFRVISFFRVDKPYDITPVGVPYCDVSVKLTDDSGCEVKKGDIGEIWYLSRFFRGYLNRPDLTEKVLIDGWYHTGDIGKFLDDGTLVVLGRKIDIRRTPQGWVVPFEIALEAKKALGLTWAYVKLFGDKTVCLYYCDDISLSPESVRAALSDILPEYALPTHCMKIEKVPYFPSGKIIRTAFPEPKE